MLSTAREALPDLTLRNGIRNVHNNCWVATFLQMLASLRPAVSAILDVTQSPATKPCADGAADAILVLISKLFHIRGDAPVNKARQDDIVLEMCECSRRTLTIQGQGDPVEFFEHLLSISPVLLRVFQHGVCQVEVQSIIRLTPPASGSTAASMSHQLSAIGLTAKDASVCLAVHVARQSGDDRFEAADPLLLQPAAGPGASATTMHLRAAALYLPTPGNPYGEQGHYVALCRTEVAWERFNDDLPRECMQPRQAMDLIATNAVLLFYEREDDGAPPQTPSRLAGEGSYQSSPGTDHRGKRARPGEMPSVSPPEAAPEVTRCELEGLLVQIDVLLRGAGGESHGRELGDWLKTFQVTSGTLQGLLRDCTAHDRMFNWRSKPLGDLAKFIKEVDIMLHLFKEGDAHPPDCLRQW